MAPKPLLLMDLPAQDIAITPGALDASTATDDSVFLRAMLPTCVPPAYWHKYGVRVLYQYRRPPSLLPASAANKQGTGTGVSKCCAIKGLVSELACSRFEQLLRLRLTTRDAPFLRTCNSLLSAPLSSKSRLRTPRKLDELLNTRACTAQLCQPSQRASAKQL